MKDIIGFYITQDFTVTSEPQSCASHVLNFLLRYRDSINCFYHLSYNVACILKKLKLGKEQLQALYETGEVHIPPDYTLYYLANKYFAVKQGEGYGVPYVKFCDISQYIPWRVEDNRTIEYAIKKAEYAQKIGLKVYQSLCKLNLSPDNLTSPINVYEKQYLRKLNLPTIDDIPAEIGEASYACTHGGWLECFKKGHYERSYDFDLSSAYSSELRNLKDLRYGEWVKSDQYEPDAEYGFLAGQVFNQSYFSPLLYTGDDMTYTPMGTWDTYITKQEYDIIRKYKLGTFEIENAWWWIPNKNNNAYPLKNIIDKLYQIKESSSGMYKEVVKRILNGMWGLTLQIKGDTFGEHFNPVWGAIVETNIRLKVFQACMDSGIIPLSIAVDGVLTEKPLNVPLNNGMGSWKLSSDCPALVISSGIVAVKDKEHTHDFSLDYGWLMNQIKEKPDQSVYEMHKPSPVSLDKSFNYNDLSKLGTIENITRTIDIEYEAKRCYIDTPKTGKDLLNKHYDSVAWDISFLKGVN